MSKVLEQPPKPLPLNPSPGRVLALDWGTERIGCAISDESQIAVRPLETLTRRNWKTLLGEIRDVCRRFDVQRIVVGLPLNLDGTHGAAAREVIRIAHNLHLSLGLPIYLQDERLTTVAAERELRDAGCASHTVKQTIDSRAAELILGDYLAEQQSC